MNKMGEIIIVQEDPDDGDIVCEAFKSLDIQNKIICFRTAKETLEHLRKVDVDPFFIISDLRMSPINGFELKQMIYADENLMKKAVPFVLCATTIDSPTFNTALLIGIQGFFVKPTTSKRLADMAALIYQYMQHCFGN